MTPHVRKVFNLIKCNPHPDNDLTHHISGVGPHAVLDSLDPAVRERHAVAAGHHARLAGLLLREV